MIAGVKEAIMIVPSSTIEAAFDQHYRRYANRDRRSWEIPYHVGCWKNADDAFSRKSFPAFQTLYGELKGRWQVFRGAQGQHWSAQEAHERLLALDAGHASKRLSECRLDDAKGLREVLTTMAAIKRATRFGPSIVAVSKFLHFRNPRLFVIVDGAMIWQKVLAHWWLWDEFVAVRKEVEAVLPGERTCPADETCDLISYLSVVLWTADLVRQNPSIPTEFAAYIRRHADDRGLPLVEYEAAAVEWFLLGLVELPPEGVMAREVSL
jgi:hypothetical protein